MVSSCQVKQIGRTNNRGHSTVAGFLVIALSIGFIIVLRKTKASERQRELEAQQKKDTSEDQE
ncbi:hypothetical protein ACFL0R_04145 [Pseudomonadota bacterium]